MKNHPEARRKRDDGKMHVQQRYVRSRDRMFLEGSFEPDEGELRQMNNQRVTRTRQCPHE